MKFKKKITKENRTLNTFIFNELPLKCRLVQKFKQKFNEVASVCQASVPSPTVHTN